MSKEIKRQKQCERWRKW